jgi:small subunit ribosomal protein SAe
MVYYLLAKEILVLRGQLKRNQEWEELVDLFYYRTINLNEQEKKEEEDNQVEEKAPEDADAE